IAGGTGCKAAAQKESTPVDSLHACAREPGRVEAGLAGYGRKVVDDPAMMRKVNIDRDHAEQKPFQAIDRLQFVASGDLATDLPASGPLELRGPTVWRQRVRPPEDRPVPHRSRPGSGAG